MPSLEQLGSEKYVLLTTFRRDGRAVSTPIWVMPDGDGLGFWTVRDSGKVKRIRNSGRVTVAPCDMRGNNVGEAVEATARLGDATDMRRVTKTLARKYGLMGRMTLLGSRLRRGADGTVVVLVS
ncbi:PPOX class F420-dependent oxidoreductase [Paractinoplanes durhamensis]|uniref:PPOX class F420-dependent oxidoreductase n=1 Tax=Paractinoplanes durhamensis TaxID=113563 RepID=A0ABQ3ZC88_9ACTN|nr:PPOX class F420-dependent oxidoreductase [Actinoplanes durhamensis]GIE07443.1 PPOX class F420-dependent oxidoreductase [Actinoplanes durhamensis]